MIENYAEKIKHESNGFIRHNGIRIVSVDEERSVLEAEITDNSRNVWGSVHGGFLCGLNGFVGHGGFLGCGLYRLLGNAILLAHSAHVSAFLYQS